MNIVAYPALKAKEILDVTTLFSFITLNTYTLRDKSIKYLIQIKNNVVYHKTHCLFR